MEATKCLVLNSDVQGSFKKFSLLFRQAEMVFVIVSLFDHFTLEPVPSVNGVWIIAFVSHHHAWVMNSKPLLMFFQLSILTSNNEVWMPFLTVLLDEAQHLSILKAKPFGLAAGIIRNTQQRHLYYNFQAPAKSSLIRCRCQPIQGDHDFFITRRGYKKWCVIISIHSPNQEVLEYLQKYASILHVQKLYQTFPANNTGHDYLVPVQFDLVGVYFYSK